MNFSNLEVPISVQTAGRFIDNNKGALEQTLDGVRHMVEWAVRGENVVKIYGRDDRQGGDKFKDVRKIAGKFNSYHREKENTVGNLWEIPDIIGFTVVVSYPSDVSRVSRIIDELISQGPLRAERIRGVHKDDREKAPKEINIDPEYGRVLADRGYFACHYNVRENHYDDLTPICEIQVKTAMHDAWGGKTHDLIYKTPTAFDHNLLKSFEALGDVLSQIDLQSDLLKDSLSNVSRVRTGKKDAINKMMMDEMFAAVTKSIEEKAKAAGESFLIHDELRKISIDTSKAEVRMLETKIINLADNTSGKYSFQNYAPFIAHFFLARNAKDLVARRKAERGLAMWVETISDPFEQSYALANAALFKFFNDDRLEAIEETEAAIKAYNLVPEPKENSKEFERYWRRGNSIYISLAYYYAEIIGTHDGRISDARENASKYLKLSLDARARLSSCPNNALVKDNELRACVNFEEVCQSVVKGYEAASSELSGEKLKKKVEMEMESNFNAIDCELFVRTQLADRVEAVEEVRRKLGVLHENPPANISALAVALFQFHDYCIRQRLAELE